MKQIVCIVFIFFNTIVQGQVQPDKVFMTSIRTVKLFPQNNQFALPIIGLNSTDQLELHFDDLGAYPKNYFYTYQLCNADWTEAQWSPFDYIRGFQQNRISQYRVSSIAQVQYVHYQAILPERSAVPTRSGNYILKVFQDADTAKLLFTRRFYVVDNKVGIAAQMQQPFSAQLNQTHQKIQLAVNTAPLSSINPQQVQTVILQNGRWDNAAQKLQPSFIRGSLLEYNAEQDCLFPAGKEYRWLDLRSLRFESDRVERIARTSIPVLVYAKTDAIRTSLRYLWYRDLNGFSDISTTESINPWWQSDYAEVEFTLATENKQPFSQQLVYIVGELSGNQISDSSLMEFDERKGVYYKRLLLKQGYYSYTYVTKDNKRLQAIANPALTEGNYWETENNYTILVYYRSFGGRHDELVGLRQISSLLPNSRL
jgi:hypothetical protein